MTTVSKPPVILYRLGSSQIHSFFVPDTEEYDAAKSIFDVYLNRCAIPSGSLVIPRYSVLPYYQELEMDLAAIGCKLINSFSEHRYVADIANYYPDIIDLTPKTWINEWVNAPEGAYVVKGRTNSRKNNWNKMMFAKDRATVPIVVGRLLDDTYIAEQQLVIREYIPLETFGHGINGVPIANEWRFFIFDGKVLVGAYYWASEPDYCPTVDPMATPEGATQLAGEVAERLGNKIRFFVVDVAKTAKGDWIVVELNDAQMSGISLIDPLVFYKKIKEKF